MRSIAYLYVLLLLLPVQDVLAQQGDRVTLALSHQLQVSDSLSDASDDYDLVREREFKPTRFWTGVGTLAGTNALGMYFLAELWYSEYETQSWSWYSTNPNTPNRGWIDDWPDWRQMDQLGHFLSGFHLARAAGSYGEWSGLSPGWSGVFGGITSSLLMTQIEIFDGWSAHYGASRVDLLSNYVGATLGGLQVAHPHLQWFTLKYSYHPSEYYDADVPFLGNAVGDYEGDTIWFTFRPNRILPAASAERWPGWLAVSLGIGAEGLAHPQSGHGSRPEHKRQVYLSLDLDWSEAIDLPEPWQSIADVASIIRIPMPALQIIPDAQWHWLYY